MSVADLYTKTSFGEVVHKGAKFGDGLGLVWGVLVGTL